MKPYIIDGSLQDDAVWYKRPHDEITWKALACRTNEMRDLVVCSGARVVMAESIPNHVYGYRYLEPDHLVSPWTPEVLLAVDCVSHVAQHYDRWCGRGARALPAWADPGLTLTDGERVYDGAARLFADLGLHEWGAFARTEKEKFLKRAAWQTAGTEGWVPFQVDINSPSLFLDVTGPAVWQTIVDAIVEDGSHDKDFIAHMRMASLEYIVKEIPGPHGNPYRQHDPESPFGYGTSTQMPSFGYRREHRSETLFVGWAAAVMPGWDLLGERFWPLNMED